MMRIVTSRTSHVVLLGVGLIAGLCFMNAGCSRSPTRKDMKIDGPKDKPPPPPPSHNLLQKFADLARYPENPRIGDDWTRLRTGLGYLDEYFAKESNRIRLNSEQRAFLAKEANLTDGELAEVESSAFRTADAHYFDECYLLRDAARSCEVPQLDPVEQTKLLFAWAMRHIILHEQVDTWLPPAIIFRLGRAGAVDRALAFLALLRQGRGEGCLIVVPGTQPLQFLVGVHDTKSKSLRLFDARLGLPVRTKDGKSVATLAEVQAEPALLEPSGITPEQTAKLEAWLACPLQALPPRMLELQNGLRTIDKIELHISAETHQRNIAEVAKIPVKIWNDKADANAKPPNSPLRALRLYLPKQEGGIDDTAPIGRAIIVEQVRVPMAGTLANFHLIPGFNQLLPNPTRETLDRVAKRMFVNYDVQTRELFLRGQGGALRARQDRLFDFSRNERLAGLGRFEPFHKEVAEWAHMLNAERARATSEARSDQILQRIWIEDEQIALLTDVDRAIRFDPNPPHKPIPVKSTIMTQILAVGVRDYLANELARSQAAVEQERAERLQAKAKQSAHDEWKLAASAWGDFYVERISLDGMIAERLDLIGRQNAAQGLFMLEALHLDVHKYFDARLRCAECLSHLGADGVKKSRDYLERTKVELAEMQKTGALAAEIKKIDAKLPNRPPTVQKHLDLLADDWSDHGSYHWLKRHIDERLKAL